MNRTHHSLLEPLGKGSRVLGTPGPKRINSTTNEYSIPSHIPPYSRLIALNQQNKVVLVHIWGVVMTPESIKPVLDLYGSGAQKRSAGCARRRTGGRGSRPRTAGSVEWGPRTAPPLRLAAHGRRRELTTLESY